MYAKLFTSLFDGSMRGHSDLILVFINLLCHADQDGIVDRHWRAISDETGLPLSRVKAAIAELEGPDDQSRSRNDEGRRLKRIDPERDWGWEIVNYKKYEGIRNATERREYMRKLMAEKRKKHQNIEENSNVSTVLAPVSKVSLLSVSSSVSVDKEEEEEATPPPAQVVNPFSEAIQKLRIGHEAFKTVPDVALENTLKGWPVDRWNEAIESLCRDYAGANIPRPNKTLANYLAGKSSPTNRLPPKYDDKKSYDRAKREILDALDYAYQAELINGSGAIVQCLSRCNDKYRDIPVREGVRVVDDAYEVWKFRNRKATK